MSSAAELAAELEAQRQQNASTLAELELARTRQAGAEAALQVLSGSAADMRNDLDAVRVSSEQLLARNAALERSTSWRLTAPLRMVGKALRRIRGS
jgi:hypothetical protein